MIEYEELLQKYDLLMQEYELLKKENNDLKKWIADTKEPAVVETVEHQNAAVNRASSPDEKIKLFRSVFSGRDDVYAKRWYSIKSGKSGYQPVCGNEWDPLLCDKTKFKCNICPNRRLMELVDSVIYAHLAGKDEYSRDVIGIYPMLRDETCRFIAVDFDDENYADDAVTFKKTCFENRIPAYIERSRSSNGAHVWIFFDEPVSAIVARKLGSGLLTHAMEHEGKIKFSSYDRLFPNQDTMPDGGFGNLIALPLQGQAKRNGNSVFVDSNFIPYSDQWAFLSCVEKLSLSQVNEAVTALCKHGDLGMLVKDEAETEKPWERSKDKPLLKSDFPVIFPIVRANMIFVEKNGLSPYAANRIRRLAAFKNPDFYRAQAMRLTIYNKPRIISTSEETVDYIALPRGCEENLIRLLDDVRVTYTVDDKTNPGHSIPVSFNGQLREEQVPAAEALYDNNTGVLSATTAFGKTVIGSYLIAKRKVNTLVLVHTGALLAQWKKSLLQFLNIDDAITDLTKSCGRKKNRSPIGSIGAGTDNCSGIVDVAIMQSLFDGDSVKEMVRNYGMVIVDECHHVSAVNFEKIMRYANARYVYGFSAIPTRQDGHHPIIFMQCGKIRFLVDAKSQAQKSSFEHIIIPRFTSFRNLSADHKTITGLYTALAESDIRNRMIVSDVKKAVSSGRCSVILTERTEHVRILADLLHGCCKHIITLVGTMSAREKNETTKMLESIPEIESVVLVASGRYIGEGFDFPRLDTLFLALPIAWKGKVVQYAGRLHRSYDGKTEVCIYDYVDIHVPVFERMYQKRIKCYASIGYQTRSEINEIEKCGIIYDGKNFLPVYKQDIDTAKNEIIIVSPFMRKNRLTQIIKLLAPAMINGTVVIVYTRPPEDFKDSETETVNRNIEYLKDAGIDVRFKSSFHQKFTVVDNKTVWYGSVNFLSFGSNEESIMRLDSEEIAGELLDTMS